MASTSNSLCSLRATALVISEAVALLLFLRLPLPSVEWSQPVGWLQRVPPEDAVIALVRLAALGIAGYLLVMTALYVVASLSRVPALMRAVRLATLPAVRHLLDGAVAAAIVAAPASMASVGAATTPASATAASPTAHVYVPVAAGDAPAQYTPIPAGDAPAQPANAAYVVRRGDSFWSIAADEVATRQSVPVEQVSEAEISRYWRALIELNASSIISGNPNLIYPGESLQLPRS